MTSRPDNYGLGDQTKDEMDDNGTDELTEELTAEPTTTELERKLGPLKVVSLVEGCTYLGLLYFWLSGNRVGTLLLGSMHGMVVMAFAGMVLLIFRSLGWQLWFALAAIATGPIGAIAVFIRLRREEPAIRARERRSMET